MTREQTIMTMMQKANQLLKEGYSHDKMMEIWDMASDWNDEHEDEKEQIFMSDYQSEDSEFVNGFMIEDDFWLFED